MKLVSKLALAAALAVPSLGLAQEMATTMADKPNTGALTFSGGVDLVSNYYFRGYLQENSGFIVQPYFGVTANLVRSDDFNVDLVLGTWNSFHDEHTGADGAGPDVWYENDLFAQVPITIPTNVGDVKIIPGYKLYQYPNGAFDSVHEATLTVAFDDTKTWKSSGFTPYEGFALNPQVTVAYELGDGNGDEEGYYEIGITPKYTFDVAGYKLPLSVPIVLGGGWDGYYASSDDGGNDFFGYLSVGVETAIPIPENIIPARYGSWSVTGGAYYMNLFSDSAEIANNESPHVFSGKVGLAFSY